MNVRPSAEMVPEHLDGVDHIVEVELGFRHRLSVPARIFDLRVRPCEGTVAMIGLLLSSDSLAASLETDSPGSRKWSLSRRNDTRSTAGQRGERDLPPVASPAERITRHFVVPPWRSIVP